MPGKSKFLFLLICLMLFISISSASETVLIKGTVTARISEDTYLIRLEDNTEAIYITQAVLAISQEISDRAVRTLYSRDISRPAYTKHHKGSSLEMKVLNILYAMLIIIYILNMVLFFRIPQKLENPQARYIKVVSGPDSGKLFKLAERYVYTIGRDLSNDIVINDKTVSRKQADLWINPKTGHLLFRNSTNTTNPVYLNGKKISKKTYKITDEDIVSIGLTNLMPVRIEEDETPGV